MAWYDGIISLFKKNTVQAKLLRGNPSLFSAFGNNIYANDIVQMCVDCIATECRKLNPIHILEKDGIQSIPKSDLQRVLKNPNIFMTTSDFLEKIVWILFLNYNCFIYPHDVYY